VSGHRLDVPELHRVLDQQRATRGMSRRGVARETGLSFSTFTRIRTGKAPDAHALVGLIV
jgi:transcriptional regulator with XRE-family HTH domain